MIFTVLSYFDNIIGPKIFLQFPNVNSHINLDYIPLIMDLYDQGFFIHECGELKTANLIFDIKDPIARGRINRLMISIILIEKEYTLNLNSFKEIIEFLAHKLKNKDDLYKGFYCESIPEAIDYYNDIKDFMYSFHQSLNTYKQNMSKISIYSLSPTGKNNIIRSLQERISHPKQQIGAIPFNRNYKIY